MSETENFRISWNGKKTNFPISSEENNSESENIKEMRQIPVFTTFWNIKN